MAFAAVISVARIIQELINSPRISLSPSCKEMMEFAYQQLESLREVLKRLDRSSKGDCRKMVNAVDARIKEAVWEFQDLIESHVDNQMLSQSDQILRYDVHLHELRPDVDDFTQKLKKMEEEYIDELDHMIPEEAPDNAVSATTDSDVRKVKLVGSSQILRKIKEQCQRYPNIWAIAVVGMAGIGKTTVCKEIFNDSFELGFECRAWVTIGRRKYPVNELERDILVQLDPNVDNQILSQSDQILRYDVHLQELTPDVDDFTQKLKKMEEEYIYELDHLMPEEELDGAVSATTDSDVRKVKMVGSSQILRKIKRNLQSHNWNSGYISVVGMAGIGKTTLCKQIFSDSFELGFECRAWVTIGRKYRANELEFERDILVQLDPNMEKRLMEEDEKKKCSHYLKEILKAKRCLLVLDDLWDTYILDHLKRCIPQEAIRSRVLVTTRLQDVATHIKPRLFVITMQLLNKDESWDLLRERVFGENKCPRELEKYGKKIADKCDGLPLTIVTVANLLSQPHNTAEYWKSVAEDKKSSIFMAAYDQMYEVLFPSYEYLPQHLKPCFLYMGVFPLNDEISKLNILRLWVAEGFLEPNEKRELEYSVEMYLEELIDNSVVIICQTSTYVFYNYVKTCRLQSAFWYLCYREARKSRFFHVLTSVADGVEENMKSQRRLSFQ